MQEVTILAFESSCDDTSVALLSAKAGAHPVIESLAVQSQDDIHKSYGGVVPELASRAHLMNLIPCLKKVLQESGRRIADVSAIASTARPGLLGSLLVGHTAAKTLAYLHEKPFISVNHLEGHLASPLLEGELLYPAVSLIVSGGHTSLYLMKAEDDFTLIGQTLDDAAGEAYDKGAKLLGLGFPGGAALEQLARAGDEMRFPFSVVRVDGIQFSFSGLKSQLARFVKKADPQDYAHLAASYQRAILDHLSAKLKRAIEEYHPKSICVVGGVARNQELRRRMDIIVSSFTSIERWVAPRPEWCTDNAAMIAYRALQLYRKGTISSLSDDVGSTSRPPVRHAS